MAAPSSRPSQVVCRVAIYCKYVSEESVGVDRFRGISVDFVVLLVAVLKALSLYKCSMAGISGGFARYEDYDLTS